VSPAAAPGARQQQQQQQQGPAAAGLAEPPTAQQLQDTAGELQQLLGVERERALEALQVNIASARRGKER
jgi:hypothetical protein